ncbi:cell wall integrity and stress response component 3 [Nasonia vitripennis]|uniref:Uncharacterized protein n=1 Tax=Nasonia vitripennis TaxID=7425 RepID=A0A7M7H9T1_NASVI|nr:cell wall integrity and stress response component 3 [Nasonia vitripennis]XP_008206049.1 cell wall integrity and stress response component 3 [Nasonia vitripennis]XP_008206050.1 cell wall integrity and stress response component 3 [Nasonia vitripennis]XP_031787568.1 cell wall integrity and stress response component 3 [Nasonia vitripennis]XP_031787569.1 cell wall integrity and stress response component 3 [Nasonia vitripennis]XP_032456329.1 cell wall integrity and stress response component 3 [Na
MFRKVVHYSIVLLLVSVKLSVDGLVNEGDVAGKGEALITQPVNVTTAAPVLSEHGQDISDAVKKTNASSDELHIQAATKENKTNTIQDKPLITNQTDSTLLYNTTANLDDEGKVDQVHPLQSVIKSDGNNNATNSTISTTLKPTTKIGDNPSNSENAETTKSDKETTLSPETTTNKKTTDPSSTVSVASTSESVTQSIGTSKSSTASTSQTTAVTDPEMATVTSTVESSTAGKTTEDPKVEPTQAKDPGMSSGIIALVMAIVFAVVVIIVYVGLLLWRRYLEFRYGNRELLVNDLEFDTNDLRHFEL